MVDRLALPDVTLVCAESHTGELSALAMAECMARAEFGDVIAFSNENIFPGHTVRIDAFNSVLDWARFIWYRVGAYINTTHMLLIHWDSWIIDTGMWSDDFLNQDYIGAPWTWERTRSPYIVGNSGFSLRSKRFMMHIANDPTTYVCGLPEDQRMCRLYRPALERRGGVRFAPDRMALDFAYERAPTWHGNAQEWSGRHFGYHGMFNWPFIGMDPDEFKKRMKLVAAHPYVSKHKTFNEMRRFVPA